MFLDVQHPHAADLLPEVVAGLSELRQLRSLTAVMAPATNSEEAVQTVLKLQHTFSQLGSHLTHLSFGTGLDSRIKLQLSAPLNCMPALQTLTCQPGFTLDAEDILYPDLEAEGAAGADPNLNAGSSSSSEAAAIVPSLTHLVINDGWDHGPLLQLLTQPSREGAAAAASRTLLQQLEFNCGGELPFELLNQLECLRSLKFTASEKHDLADLTSTAPALSKQLQGLTVVCSGPSEQHDEWASPYRPVPLLTALTALTSLKVIGTPHMLLCASQDLPLLT
ncbi:hypothetical protein OEZ85_005686 [Tetradesmus obliquus]|uniref:Uncharacterized protein n=1 Tax=Tetradesmus obliquus TaxID=3088 RepID=A0ABY8UHI0_TETOB|nr:hypothetical protein OEZ85_005686 [Tetradesmus obliquus]